MPTESCARKSWSRVFTTAIASRSRSRCSRPLAGDANLILNFGTLGEQKVAIQSPNAAIEFPINEHGQMLVNFRGPEDTFPHISFTDILNKRVPAADLQGKVILVGMTARGEGDRFNTPMGGDFPGVEIHANAIDNIIQNDVIVRSADDKVERVIGLLLGLLMVVAAAFLSANLAAMAAVILGGSYILIAQHLLWDDHQLIGIVYPLAMLAATYVVTAGFRYYEETKEKRYLRHAFEHYLHPSVISSVLSNPEGLRLGGQRRVLTVLFADIVNYTMLSESMQADPAALVTMLNEYMTTMTDRILDSGGVVDKIRGDSIMAFWGAPNDMPNHAQVAIDQALGMLVELKKLNDTDPRFKSFDIGIGIATGEVIVGNFGGRAPLRLFGHRRHGKSRLAPGRINPQIRHASCWSAATRCKAPPMPAISSARSARSALKANRMRSRWSKSSRRPTMASIRTFMIASRFSNSSCRKVRLMRRATNWTGLRMIIRTTGSSACMPNALRRSRNFLARCCSSSTPNDRATSSFGHPERRAKDLRGTLRSS